MKEAKKYKVFLFSDGDHSIILEKISGVTEWIKQSLLDAEVGDDFEFTVLVKEMTRKELNNLEEADD